MVHNYECLHCATGCDYKRLDCVVCGGPMTYTGKLDKLRNKSNVKETATPPLANTSNNFNWPVALVVFFTAFVGLVFKLGIEVGVAVVLSVISSALFGVINYKKMFLTFIFVLVGVFFYSLMG